MDTKMSILFYGKRAKITKDHLIPIYLRVTINGKRFEQSSQRYIEPSKWSQASGKAKGNSEESRTLNAFLDTLKQKVYHCQKCLIQEGIEVTLDSFRRQWRGTTERSRYLIEVFQQHNDQLKILIGSDCSKATWGKYKITLDHTVAFLKWKFGQSDIDLQKLEYNFIADYEFYLKSVGKCNHNTTIKYISNLRKIIYVCLKNGWLLKDPFLGYKMSKKEVIREFLTEAELQILLNKNFAIDRLNQVRDIFIFSCYTGLSYIDAKKLKRSEIGTGLDGTSWIFTKREKTEAPVRIPLLPAAQLILDRYNDHPQCVHKGSLLPVPSNQKLNAYLKEVADICGIQKHLTFHMARHTFATTVTLNNGVPIESVSKMLGHRSIKITQQYAKILDRKVSEDMTALKQKLQKERQQSF